MSFLASSLPRRALIAGLWSVVASLFFLSPVHAAQYDVAAEATWQTDAGSTVRAITSIGSTGYIGGDFASHTSPDGLSTVTQPWLAAVDASGAVLASFAPALDGVVHDLEVSADGTVLYAAGEFANVNGSPTQGVVALDPVTGATVAGGVPVVDGDVLDMAVDGASLYLVGKFQNVNATPRLRMAKVDTSTGIVDPGWAPSAVAAGAGVWAVEVVPAANRVYVGGFFTSIDNVPSTGGLAALDAITGAVDTNFLPNPVDEVYGIAATTDRVYAALGGPGGRLGIYNPTNGAVRATWYGDGDVQTIQLSDESIYVGGHQEVFGTATAPWLSRIDRVTDQIDPTFAPDITALAGVGVWALHETDDHLWVGGQISAAAPVTGQGVLRFPVIPPGPPDPPTPPTAPSNLVATAVSDSSVFLQWSASSDNSGLVGYRIFRDGLEVASSVKTSFVDRSVAPEVSYTYTVRAIDPDGTLSPVSNSVTVTTLAALSNAGMVRWGSAWQYDDTGIAPPADWMAPTFDDSGWAQGGAPLAANEGSDPDIDVVTTLAVQPSVRFRQSFELLADQVVSEATLRYFRDDGSQVFVNGNEVHRDNLPAGVVDHTTAAESYISGPSEEKVLEVALDPALFVAGTNVLAVGIHNAPGSIDMRFGASLTLRIGVTNWELTFSDEFEGSAVDSTKWNVENSGFGSGGNSLHCMRPDNVAVEDGLLVLQAREESVVCNGGMPMDYTSGMVDTQGKGEWTYGRYEVRAKLPDGQGLWPAAWTGSVDNVYGAWPASGELDIFEALGHQPAVSIHTAHWGPVGGPSLKSNTSTTHPVSLADAFHVFRMEWYPTEIRWYVDDLLVHVSTPEDGWSVPGGPAGPGAPFDQDVFLRLSLFVGGNFPGDPDATTVFPADYSVDYVRVYGAPGYCNNKPATIMWGPTATATPGDDVIVGTPGPDTIAGGAGNDSICGGGGDDTLSGNSGEDALFGEAGEDALRGGPDNDELHGGTEDDFLSGLGGEDVLYGDEGEDSLLGGAGVDMMWGGPDKDFMQGGDGDDFMYGEGGNDRLSGNNGADTIEGGDQPDRVYGGDGNDVIDGGAANDLLNGQGDNDTISGGLNNDVINGGTGSDMLSGNEGDDELRGQDGDDDLFGGEGDNDILIGGAGADDHDGGPGTGDRCNGAVDTDPDTAVSCEILQNIP